MNCTKCEKQINDFKVVVTLSVKVDRITESGAWESVANTELQANEILCKNCFDKFVDVLDKTMNEESHV